MTDKLFDSFIKSKLEQYDSGAPMHVWERMKKDEDDEPAGFLFWILKNKYLLLSLLLIIGVSAGGYLFIRNDKQEPAAIINPLKKQSASAEDVSNQAAGNNESVNTSSASVLQNSLQEETKNPTGNYGTQKPELSERKESPRSAVQTFATTNVKANHTSSTLKYPSKRKRIAATATVRELKDNNHVNSETVQPSNSEMHGLPLAGHMGKARLLPLFQNGVVAMPDNKPSCPTINGPRRKELFLELYAGPDYNVRSLTSSVAPATYITERNNNENYRTSFSAGIRLVKNLGEKSLIKTGINYSQINERLRIVAENSKQFTQVITIRTVVRSPGDTLFVRDTMFFEQNGTRYRTTYNRYRFIDIPLIFSYEFGNPELMHFSVNAGPVFNVVSFYGGEVLDTTYKPMRISTSTGSNANNWRSNIGIGLFASVSMYKRYNDRIHLFAEPYVRYNLNPVTQAGSNIKQRYFITGMQLGIRYNLTAPGQRYR